MPSVMRMPVMRVAIMRVRIVAVRSVRVAGMGVIVLLNVVWVLKRVLRTRWGAPIHAEAAGDVRDEGRSRRRERTEMRQVKLEQSIASNLVENFWERTREVLHCHPGHQESFFRLGLGATASAVERTAKQSCRQTGLLVELMNRISLCT